MSQPLFEALNSERIAAEIRTAEYSVCYAAPGMLNLAAEALVDIAEKIGAELITVCLDFDERVLRMGYGHLEAVQLLRDAGIEVRSTPGLRIGLVIVDGEGFIFAPPALLLEGEAQESLAPNAVRLSRDQATEAMARLSPAAKLIAIQFAKTPEEEQHLLEQAVEMPSAVVSAAEVSGVAASLKAAPPVSFDVARQVRVYTAYLQYVEMKLTGASIQRRRVAIPESIQNLGGAKDLEGRLRTTFELIENSSELSSKALDTKLATIRKDFTRSLGKMHGRVVLKSAKPHLEERFAEFRKDLEQHQSKVEAKLQATLDESVAQIVGLYVPAVLATPPDSMRGSYQTIDEASARNWLNFELSRVIPKASALIQRMSLDVRYMDVTFETLNRDDFLESLQAAYPTIAWDGAHEEFRAAGAVDS